MLSYVHIDKCTLKYIQYDCFQVVKTREEWVFQVPAQMGLLTSQIMWTEEVEDAMEEQESGSDDALKKYRCVNIHICMHV
jgi:hypothetical protein